MTSSRTQATRRRYRLRGLVDGKERTFPLVDGDNPVGGAEGNQVRLSVRGVSRHHAVLTVGDPELLITDLDSKNGTFVGGRTVRTAALSDGDEVRFGEAVLRLEEVEPEDAEIALSLAGPAPPPGVQTREETEWLSGVGSAPPQRWLAVVASLVEHLTVLPEADLGGALAILANVLEARGGVLAEWDQEGRPIILAATGEVGTPPPLAGLPTGSRPLEPAIGTIRSVPRLTVAAYRQPEGGALALLLWGEVEDDSVLAPVLDCGLRLFGRFKPQPRTDLPEPTVAEESSQTFPAGYLPGTSPQMKSLYQQMRPLADSDIPLLISGETGVGKEPVARTLHLSSPRRDGPWVAVNCAAIPADLLEAELFGIGAGVATGVRERRGKLAEADGGTLLLDEIGDMPVALQAKLLRVLQDKEVHPLGRPGFAIDVRILAATNTDLPRRVETGAFRADLYYRVAGYLLQVPPLRERKEDLPPLVGHFTRTVCAEAEKWISGITVKALRALTEYPWPGNVRELEHEVRRLVYLCPEGEVIESRMLSDEIGRPRPPADTDPSLDPAGSWVLSQHLEAVERRLLGRALRHTGGNQSQAARLLEISRNGLAKRLKRLGLQPTGAPRS